MNAKHLMSVVAAAMSLAAFSAEVWTNVADKEPSVKTASNWEDGSAPAFNNPSEPVDVEFSDEPDFLQTIKWDAAHNSDYIWYVGDVSGDSRRRIALNKDNSRELRIADASRFQGYIRSFHALNSVCNVGEAGSVATVNQVLVEGRQNLRSQNEGSTLVANRVFGTGVFEVNKTVRGSAANVGTVEIGAIEGGPRAHLKLNGGTLVLHGAPYGSPAVVGDPFLHLDASDDASLEKAEADGRVFVSRWNDVRGNGLYASQGASDARPFLDGGCVSFGSFVGTYGAFGDLGASNSSTASAKAEIGPAGWLSLSSVRSDVREVFFVFRDNSRLGHNAQVFGAPDGAKDVFERTCRWMTNVGYLTPNLFRAGPDVAEITAGDVRIDGARIEGFAKSENPDNVQYQMQDFSDRLHVVSVGLDGTAAINRIAAGEHGVGGLSIAEVLIYTNALTSAERRQVNAYLRAKWQPAEEAADLDVASIEFCTRPSAIDVPSGSVRVGALSVDSNAASFTKKGDGVLEAENVAADTSITVEGGTVAFVKAADAETPDAAEPAARPDVWFDAAASDSYAKVEGVGDYSGTLWATNWWDVRNGTNACGFTVMAECERVARNNSTDNYGDWPVVTTGPFGRAVLDFGEGHAQSAFTGITTKRTTVTPDEGRPASAAFEVKKNGKTTQMVAVQRTFFIALKRKHVEAVVFGGMDFSPMTDKGAISQSYGLGAALGGVWTVNGSPFDPVAKAFPLNEWIVVGVETPVAVSMMKIGAQNVSYLVGGMQIGEILAYDRVLTAAERRQTETYLMRRWVDELYEPEARETSEVASMTFADGVATVLDSDVDMSVGKIEASGALVKQGEGRVTVKTLLGSGVTSICATGGSLFVSVSPDLFRSATVHLDASKTDFFDFAEGGAAGGDIAAWRDCDGRTAYYAKSESSFVRGNATYPFTNGVLKTATDGATGLLADRNYVTFGASHTYGEGTAVPADGGGMRFVNSSGTYANIANVREMHYVFRRRQIGNNPIVGSEGISASSLVPSGYQDTMFWKDCTTACNSPKRLDEDGWHADNYWLVSGNHRHSTDQFYVCSIAFTDAVGVNSIALDRNGSGGWGGIDLCELIIYTGATNTLADANAIHSWLLAKWKGAEGGSALPVTMGTLATDGGASVSVAAEEGVVLRPGELTLDVVFDTVGGWTQNTVAGALELPVSGTVHASAQPGAEIEIGEYTLLAADSISGSIRDWRVDSSGMPRKYWYALAVRDSRLVLRVVKPSGVMLIFK